MKKRDFIGYVLSLAVVLLYPLFTPPAISSAWIQSVFEVESSGLRMDELYVPFFNFSHLHFQTNKVFVIENLNADPDILFNYINLEVSSTPQFHSYTLRKILEIHDEIVAKVRFQEAGTEVLVRIVETDFSTGDSGSYAYSVLAYFKVEKIHYAVSTSLWGRETTQPFSDSESTAIKEQAAAEVRAIVRQIQKGIPRIEREFLLS